MHLGPSSVLSLLLFFHVLFAIIAVGSNLTYPVWLRLVGDDDATLLFALRSIKRIDRYVANTAYGLLFVTGAMLALAADIPFTTAWLATAIALYVAVALVGVFVYGPVTRHQIAALELGGRGSPEHRRWEARANALGVATIAAVLAILFLMVTKPF